MDTKTFEQFVKSGAIERVTLFRPSPDSTWQVHAYGEGVPPDVSNPIELDGGGGRRSWGDLSTAHAYVRKHGYWQIIEIDEGHAR
jgi:hypothetical protein